MKRKYYKKLETFPTGKTCNFCHTSLSDYSVLGEIFQTQDLIVHYFCLLSASEIEQNGRDEEGLLGFFPRDIKKEIKRSHEKVCSYCQKKGATIKCVDPSCSVLFHLPCGLKNGSLHQYFGSFRSFCKKHKPKQAIPSTLKKNSNCLMCMNKILVSKEPYIWPPCCKPEVLMHKICCQKYAANSGYSLKCPLCNNKDTFGEGLRKCGIYIPDQEPTWELEEANNRDSDSIVCAEARNNQCKCPKGSLFSSKSSRLWYIEVCVYCGSGMHLGCMPVPLKGKQEYKCESCAPIDLRSKDGNGSVAAVGGASVADNTSPPQPIAPSADVINVSNLSFRAIDLTQDDSDDEMETTNGREIKSKTIVGVSARKTSPRHECPKRTSAVDRPTTSSRNASSVGKSDSLLRRSLKSGWRPGSVSPPERKKGPRSLSLDKTLHSTRLSSSQTPSFNLPIHDPRLFSVLHNIASAGYVQPVGSGINFTCGHYDQSQNVPDDPTEPLYLIFGNDFSLESTQRLLRNVTSCVENLNNLKRAENRQAFTRSDSDPVEFERSSVIKVSNTNVPEPLLQTPRGNTSPSINSVKTKNSTLSNNVDYSKEIADNIICISGTESECDFDDNSLLSKDGNSRKTSGVKRKRKTLSIKNKKGKLQETLPENSLSTRNSDTPANGEVAGNMGPEEIICIDCDEFEPSEALRSSKSVNVESNNITKNSGGQKTILEKLKSFEEISVSVFELPHPAEDISNAVISSHIIPQPSPVTIPYSFQESKNKKMSRSKSLVEVSSTNDSSDSRNVRISRKRKHSSSSMLQQGSYAINPGISVVEVSDSSKLINVSYNDDLYKSNLFDDFHDSVSSLSPPNDYFICKSTEVSLTPHWYEYCTDKIPCSTCYNSCLYFMGKMESEYMEKEVLLENIIKASFEKQTVLKELSLDEMSEASHDRLTGDEVATNNE